MKRTTASALVLTLGLVASAGVVRAEPGVADIQWAQRILTEKGYDIGGRADGRMTVPTRAALKKYQATSGLPATGELDSATVDKMMVGRPAKPGVGALSVPKPGQRVVERDEKPRAAPTQRVGTEGGGDVINPAVVSGVPRGAGDFNPDRPAATGASSAQGGGTGQVSGVDPRPLGAPVPAPQRSAADWLRPLLAAVLAGVIAGMAGLWWLSGRRRRPDDDPRAPRAASTDRRTEPTFDDAPAVSARADAPEGSRRLEPRFDRTDGPRPPATTTRLGFAARPLMSERRRPAN